MKPRLVVAQRVTEAVAARARAGFEAVLSEGEGMDAAALLGVVTTHRADALLFGSSTPLARETVARLPAHLRIAASIGVGFDHIDVAAARTHRLAVSNTPDVLDECVADFTLLLILAACRRAHEYEAIMRAGWRQKFLLDDLLGLRVSGRTLGILGMGRIGRAVAARARGFGMRILYHNRNRLPPEREQGAGWCASLGELAERCDILAVHAPGGPGTEKIVDRAVLARMKPGSVLVNVARGSLVDEQALLEALGSGHLFAAGLDVFQGEPAFDLRFAALPNVFLAPHMGSATRETRDAMGMRALDNIDAVLAGREAPDALWRP